MKEKRLSGFPATVFGLSAVLVLMLGLAVTISLAESPLGQALRVEYTLSPSTLRMGEPAVGTLVIHNASPEAETADTLTVRLAEGLAYVGQAVDSDVTAAAQVNGPNLRWTGPFDLAAGKTLTVRYWVVAASATPGEYPTQAMVSFGGKTLSVVETSLEIEPAAVPAAVAATDAFRLPISIGEAGDLLAIKTAGPTELEPGSGVAYTVVFTNTSDDDVAMDAITDVLPVPFQYVGLAVGSEVMVEPVDTDEPEIAWQGTFTVPAADTLTLRYWVWVPIEAEAGFTPYSNTVTAAYDGTLVGPAESSVTLMGPNVQVTKSVWPLEVLAGEPVTYTVVLENVGNAQGVLDLISDTLPTGFAFLRMLPGSTIPDPPEGVTETIVWHGPLTMTIGEVMTLTYQTRSSMASGLEAPTNQVVALIEEKFTGAAEAAVQVDPRHIYLPIVAKQWDFPYFEVTKTAAPAQVYQGDLTEYTVRFTNHGDLPGVLDEMSDTLPEDFAFVSMEAGSDVTAPPIGTTGTIVWSGPFVVGAHETLTLVYSVDVGYELGTHVNSATATTLVGRAPQEPASAAVVVQETVFTIAKTASSPQVYEGETVTYTVNLVNAGGGDGTLDQIGDTLPAGFTFLGMAPGSDITQPPVGTTGTIVWNGPFDVGSGETLTLIYQVQVSDVPGTYTNSATATALVGRPPEAPASAAVVVTEPFLLLEDFESGIDRWEPFLNYWRLTDEQWYWGPSDGFAGSGAVTHDCTLGKDDPERGAEDALLMYLEAGSDQWTDYRVETKLLLRGGMSDGEWILEGGYPVGLWVRGHYQDVGDEDTGGWVTGYYLVIGGKPDKDMFVRLLQLQTLTDCWDQACDNPQNLYDFNNPHELWTNKLDFSFERNRWYTLAVEVRGDRIMAWVDGVLGMDYVDTKEPFLTGTVGVKTYKSWTVSFDDIIVTPLH